MRRQGIGRLLFREAVSAVARMGAEKLYISAHSAAETQAFYRGLGCLDAREILQFHADKEPYDCQLEYLLDHDSNRSCLILKAFIAIFCKRAAMRGSVLGHWSLQYKASPGGEAVALSMPVF